MVTLKSLSDYSFFIFLKFLFYIDVELICNISGVQQSDSFIYMKLNIYIYIYIFFSNFVSIIGYYKILNIVPWAIQQVLVGYLFCT